MPTRNRTRPRITCLHHRQLGPLSHSLYYTKHHGGRCQLPGQGDPDGQEGPADMDVSAPQAINAEDSSAASGTTGTGTDREAELDELGAEPPGMLRTC